MVIRVAQFPVYFHNKSPAMAPFVCMNKTRFQSLSMAEVLLYKSFYAGEAVALWPFEIHPVVRTFYLIHLYCKVLPSSFAFSTISQCYYLVLENNTNTLNHLAVRLNRSLLV